MSEKTRGGASPETSGGIVRWREAWNFAAEAHAAQKVPGGPSCYLQHLGSVALEVLGAHLVEPIGDLDLAVQCAILHDAVEDQEVPLALLTQLFGADVAAGVAALSKDPSLDKGVAMIDSLARIRAQPQAVWMVKLADRITNLQTPPAHWSAAKIACYRLEAQQILEALGAAHAHLAHRLAQAIGAYPG
jgi:(p)ppGpp synthase/HD superfamily hydrolase